MIRKAVGLVTSLGLIGGAGSVVYSHNGVTTVRIKDSAGHVQSVQIKGNGKSFSCPAGTHNKLEPIDIQAGRIELTLRQVRQQEHAIEAQYPQADAPRAVLVRYDGLSRRDKALVAAFNVDVQQHNAIIDQTCTAGN